MAQSAQSAQAAHSAQAAQAAHSAQAAQSADAWPGDQALDAIGNPTRRALLRLLRDGERTVREMTDALPVTQSAVSQHLRVLGEAGLVTVRPDGTRRLYAVDLNGLAEVRAWVDSFWDDVLAAFVEHAEAERADEAGPIRTRPSENPPTGHQSSDTRPGEMRS